MAASVLGSRVWGRDPSELTIVVGDPVGRGLLRAPLDGRGRVGGPLGRTLPGRPRRFVVRPALGRDHARINEVRLGDRAWLAPWEATLPPGADEQLPDIGAYRRKMDRQARSSEVLVMALELDDEVVGQISLSNVQWGAMCLGTLGYWVSSDVAGRGVGSLGVAIVLDLVLGELGLHRVEVNVRPENQPSLGLCRKLGLREEGLRERFMNIAGVWADHVGFATDIESMPVGGFVRAGWGTDLAGL